jgi:hypothetical protein
MVNGGTAESPLAYYDNNAGAFYQRDSGPTNPDRRMRAYYASLSTFWHYAKNTSYARSTRAA